MNDNNIKSFIDENIFECKICKRQFKNYKSLTFHIVKTHKISIKCYYDQFIKIYILDEGKCHNIKCLNETKFQGIHNGYSKYCSCKCSATSREVREKSKKKQIKKKLDMIIQVKIQKL